MPPQLSARYVAYEVRGLTGVPDGLRIIGDGVDVEREAADFAGNSDAVTLFILECRQQVERLSDRRSRQLYEELMHTVWNDDLLKIATTPQ